MKKSIREKVANVLFAMAMIITAGMVVALPFIVAREWNLFKTSVQECSSKQ